MPESGKGASVEGGPVLAGLGGGEVDVESEEGEVRHLSHETHELVSVAREVKIDGEGGEAGGHGLHVGDGDVEVEELDVETGDGVGPEAAEATEHGERGIHDHSKAVESLQRGVQSRRLRTAGSTHLAPDVKVREG